MEEDLDRKVEALLQHTLEHIMLLGNDPDPVDKTVWLDLLVKGDREEYDRRLERFHQMLSEAKGSNNLGKDGKTLPWNQENRYKRYPKMQDMNYGFERLPQANWVLLADEPMMQQGPSIPYLQHGFGADCFTEEDLHQAYVQGLWQGGNLAEGIWDDTYGCRAVEPTSRLSPFRSEFRPALSYSPMPHIQVCEAAKASAESLPPRYSQRVNYFEPPSQESKF
eukprot:symbB.v1.2.024853.t1/scaffold2380.1/size80551/1